MTSALPLLPSIRELGKEGRIHAVKCTRNGDAITALRAECGEDILICDPYESHALANLLRSGQHTLSADPEPYLYQLPEMRCGFRRIADSHSGPSRTVVR